jgi:hypothetical protein
LHTTAAGLHPATLDFTHFVPDNVPLSASFVALPLSGGAVGITTELGPSGSPETLHAIGSVLASALAAEEARLLQRFASDVDAVELAVAVQAAVMWNMVWLPTEQGPVGAVLGMGSYHIMSCHVISYHIISYHIISYHIISYHIIIAIQCNTIQAMA